MDIDPAVNTLHQALWYLFYKVTIAVFYAVFKYREILPYWQSEGRSILITENE